MFLRSSLPAIDPRDARRGPGRGRRRRARGARLRDRAAQARRRRRARARARGAGRALVVGAEHVSFSALLTLRRAGADVVAIVTERPRHQSLAVVRAAAAARYRTPLWTRTAVRAIHGDPRVEGVELEDLESGATRTLACETVIFTADWIPDHELAAIGGLELDAGTRGPRVDTALRSSRPGVLAAGNLVHAAEPADVAALSGRHAGASAARWLSGARAWPAAAIP